MSDEPSTADYIHEMHTSALKLADQVNDAGELHAKGDDQGACETIAISHYVMADLQREYDGLLADFKAQGITPGAG